MWIDAVASSELPLDVARAVMLGRLRVLLARTPAGLFAVHDQCPHQSQTMAGGILKPRSIECPWHSVEVDLATGAVLNDMGWLNMKPIAVFPVKEEQGRILVDLPENIDHLLK